MTREEMLSVLLEENIQTLSSDDVTLREWLLCGWKGYAKYTNKELKDEIEERLTPEEIKDLLESYIRRTEAA